MRCHLNWRISSVWNCSGEVMVLPLQPSVWRDWGAAAWGLALLRHYFTGYDAQPVSRLAISAEELAKVAGAEESDAAAALAAFLRAVQCSAEVFRRHLSRASLEPGTWNRREPPPFLAWLFFTCYAAAPLDAETADEGVFRERVRQLLGHAAGTTYALGDLSLLWEELATWLQERRNDGEPYRALRLPDRGWMRLIGYSVRLAFPQREDWLRLRDLLAASGVGPSPTVPEAFQIIGRARGRFSDDFQYVFDRARDALANGRDVAELHALWSAILEAAALARPFSRPGRIRYRLLAQEDELGRIDPFVVAAGVLSGVRGEAQLSRLDEPFDEFDQLVCAANGSPGLIAKLLLENALGDKLSGLGSSSIPRAVREGVLLFQRVDSAVWELAVRRPNEGRVRTLVRSDLSAGLLRLVDGSPREARDTRFDGWCELADFDITQLVDPRDGAVAELASVRCLQRVEVGPQLHLVGGIRLDGGFLGIGSLLPEVHCIEAEDAVLFRLSEESGEDHSTLVTMLEGDRERRGVFTWPMGHGDLEGAFVFAGRREGFVLAPREVRFHSRGLNHAYAGPTTPDHWLIEAGTVDVAPAAEARDAFLEQELCRAAPPPAVDRALAESLPMFTNYSADDEAQLDRFVEALAAISASRKGIGEAELIEILGKVIPDANGFAVWGIVRAWLEAGYVDCLTRRRWHGRVYFARQPRLVLMPDDSSRSIRAVLHGLSPYRLRAAARDLFARGGATPAPAASLSRFVPAPLSWRLESAEHAREVAKNLGILGVAGVCEPEQLVGDFDTAISDDALLPLGYELQRIWDWAAGRFRRPSGSRAADDVRIEHYTRTNGPDQYVVTSNDQRRTTRSRSWALLDGFRRAGRKAFSPVGSVVIARSGEDGPQVPLPVARAIALRAGIVGGPAEAESAGRYYAYAVSRASEQRWLLTWLSGMKAGETVLRRFAWLLAAASASNYAAERLPADLRRRLRDLRAVPDAHSMADRCIPRRLHPHVRRAVELAEP